MAEPTIHSSTGGQVNGSGQGDATNPLDVTGCAFSGTNRRALVAIGYNDDNAETVSSVTIDPGGADETALSQVANTPVSIQDDGHTEFWDVADPPSGTFTVRVIISAGLNSTGHVLGACVYALKDVDNTTAVVDTGTFSGSTANPTVTLSLAGSDDTIFCCHFIEDRATSTMDSPGTEDYNVNPAHDSFGSGHQSASSSTTAGWTTVVSDKTVASGVAYRGSAAVAVKSTNGLHHIPEGIGDPGGSAVPQTLHTIEKGISA